MADVTGFVQGYVKYALSDIDFYGLILPLLFYTLILALYGVFIWIFYRSISKRDLFVLAIKSSRKPRLAEAVHVVKYIFFFPVLTFVWFAALTFILFLLSRSQSTEGILFMAMAMIGASRISSYYKEELSQDISKILPLAILGIFVVDPAFFSLSLTISRIYELPALVPLLTNYFAFVVLMEFIMRLVLATKRKIYSSRRQ